MSTRSLRRRLDRLAAPVAPVAAETADDRLFCDELRAMSLPELAALYGKRLEAAGRRRDPKRDAQLARATLPELSQIYMDACRVQR
jgi:hypothetical protein